MMHILSFLTPYLWFFKPFEGRVLHLVHSYQGYLKTGVPWVEFFDGKTHSFCAVDDPGIYWIIPRLANFMPCSFEMTIKLFFYGTIVVCFFGGLLGFFTLYKNLWERIVAIVGFLALFLLTIRVGDVYIFYSCVPVLCIPWVRYLFSQDRSTTAFATSGALIGITSLLVHYIRGYSSMATLFFIICVCLGTDIIDRKRKIVFLMSLLAGGMLLWSFYRSEQKKYELFLTKHRLETVKLGHPFWHNIYIGFGFLKFMNPDKIVYEDACAARKAEQLKKEYPDKSYEELLKDEVFRLIRQERFFVIQTIFSKIGVLLLFLLLAMNFGLLAAWYVRKSIYFDFAYMIALLVSSLFPLLTMPFLTYSLGVIALAVLWGVESINNLLHAPDRFSDKSIALFSLRRKLANELSSR